VPHLNRLLLPWFACLLLAPLLRALPPTVTVSRLVRAAAETRLEWTASSPELEFTVESRAGLDSGTWTPLPGQAWPIQALTFTHAGTGEDARFFRVLGTPRPGQRGRIISVTQVGTTLTTAQIQLLFNFQGVPITAVRDVNYYKVIYETVDPHGLRTQASGALVVPVGEPGPLPVVSYQHGTILLREDVPSRLNLEGFLGVAMATSGYLAVLPDYLGLGDSPGFHPYHHAKSAATCVVDLLRAARTWSAANSVALSGKLFLTGYSQGGHATLAALRAIEAFHADEFTVTACAAGAGAYDLSGVTATDFLSGRPQPNPYYLPYLLLAYQDVYGLPGGFLAGPYASQLPPLFNGQHDSAEINPLLPASPTGILHPEALASFRDDPKDALRTALRDNDLTRWRPLAPLRLYHCSGDLDVSPLNASAALAEFQARGAAQVQLLDPSPGADHGGCVEPTLLAAKAWFDSLR